MLHIDLEDIATVFISDFVKHNKKTMNINNFLKLNYQRRRKLVEKTLDKIEQPFS